LLGRGSSVLWCDWDSGRSCLWKIG
jgi:hypothetical protein